MTIVGNKQDSEVIQRPACDAGRIYANDPSVYEQIVQPWQLFCSPIDRGSFSYDICYLKTPAMTLYRERFDLSCHLRGLSPPNTFTFSVPVRLGSRTTYWKSPLEVSGFPAMLPGGLDVVVDSGQIQLVILLNPLLLIEHLSQEQVLMFKRAAKNHLLPSRQEDVTRLGAWILGLIREAQLHPQMLLQANAVKSMEQDMLRLLAQAIHIPLRKNSSPVPSKRRKGLERALSYLREVDPSAITVPELARASGVSLRTLEYGFLDVFNLSPVDFMRRQRFHAARFKCMNAEPGSTTVANIAHESGFYHLGRFSAHYKKLFGEQPSATLQVRYSNLPKSVFQNFHA